MQMCEIVPKGMNKIFMYLSIKGIVHHWSLGNTLIHFLSEFGENGNKQMQKCNRNNLCGTVS